MDCLQPKRSIARKHPFHAASSLQWSRGSRAAEIRRASARVASPGRVSSKLARLGAGAGLASQPAASGAEGDWNHSVAPSVGLAGGTAARGTARRWPVRAAERASDRSNRAHSLLLLRRADRDPPRIHQEDAENSAPRSRACAGSQAGVGASTWLDQARSEGTGTRAARALA